MRNEWERQSFEDCIEKVIYTPKIQRKDFLNEGTYPIVSQEEAFINGYWNDESDLFKVRTPVVVFGDHTKVLKYVDFDFVLGADGVKILQPRNFLLPRFFFYQLQTANLDSLGYARHYKLLRELEISYPCRTEQQRIVGILDKACEGIDAAKANAESNLQNARALFESYLESVFSQRESGWVEKKIEQCFKVRSGDFLPAKKMADTGEIDVYGGNGIAGKHDTKNLSGENIVIGRVGAKCGNVRHVRGDIWLTDNAFYISEFYCDFDFGFLERLLTRKQLRDTANQAAQPVISYTTIKDVPLEFPKSTSGQKLIAGKLDALEAETQRLAAIYQRQFAALDALKKSLLHHAFTGKL
jgi:type I restriction enzyme, S subunit